MGDESPKPKTLRRQISEALVRIWRATRNSEYFVIRGAPEWASWDWNARPLAVAIIIPEFPLFRPNGVAVVTFEVMQRAPNWQAELKDVDDSALDDLWDDVSEVITKLLAETREADSTVPLVLRVNENTPGLEAANVDQVGVQGLTCSIVIEV